MPAVARPVALLLMLLLCIPHEAFASQLTPDAAKAKIEHRGLGHTVRLVLTDKSELKGIITEIGSEECKVALTKSDVQTIPYAHVSEYHNGSLSKGAKIAWIIGGFVVVVVLYAVIWAAAHPDD